jgi:hypothetical protein
MSKLEAFKGPRPTFARKLLVNFFLLKAVDVFALRVGITLGCNGKLHCTKQLGARRFAAASNPCFTSCLGFLADNQGMNLLTATKEFNRRAAREKWYYHCDPTLAFSDSYYDPLLALWREKCNGRAMPRRSDFTPRDLKDILRNLVIFERGKTQPSQYRWRVIGTAITQILGHHTGKTFAETLSPDHVARWVASYDMILDGGQPLRFLGHVHLKGREYLDAEHCYVPLANDKDEPVFILGLCRYTSRRSENDDVWENQIASIPGGLH